MAKLPAQDIVERFWPAACDSIDGPHASVIHQMIRDGNGGYVRFSDYKSLTADNEALKKERDDWRASATEFKGLTDEWQARADALAVALDDMLLEYGDRYDSECRLKNASELDMIAKARAALGDRP